jgi:malonyl-CoA decarboxylase
MKSFLAGIANAGRELLGLKAGPPSAEAFAGMSRDLLKLKGEAAAIAIADTLHSAYASLEPAQRREFFGVLLEQLEPDPEKVEAAIAEWRSAPGPDKLLRLNQATESSRRELIRALNVAPGGTEALVRMRADLLDSLAEDPALSAINDDFSYVFQSWFNRGFLSLEKIDWQTPAFILEKLITYEAVHEIRGWDDLRRRLADDRRCFAFFHPALPDEPLIFVQVALVSGLASGIEDLLAPAETAANSPDTAVFYSISNCQRGLTGVSFGNFLIKQVVDMLAVELPTLNTYATLSPVPGFRRWLDAAVGSTGDADEGFVVDEKERAKLELLRAPDWPADTTATKALGPILCRLCAHYLLNEKRGNEPLDPVARFHLRNGARLERINWLADPSSNGVNQSLSLMVNYVYDRKTVLRNHEAFSNNGEIAASSAVRKLAG